MALSVAQIDALNPGDLLADPSGEEVWFVHRNLAGRDGIRIIRQDGYTLAGRDMMAVLRHLDMARPAKNGLSLLERIQQSKVQQKKARRAAQIQKEFEESLANDPAPRPN
jgi:hypothetical protein